MKWIDEFCDSVWSALFLCGIIFLTGMLFGAGINSQTFIITAGSIGSFLAGTGTIAALYFAKITIEDWKAQKPFEMAFEAYHNVQVRTLGLAKYVSFLEVDQKNKDTYALFKVIDWIRDDSFMEDIVTLERAVKSIAVTDKVNGLNIVQYSAQLYSAAENLRSDILYNVIPEIRAELGRDCMLETFHGGYNPDLARFLDLERPKKEKVMAIINGSSHSFGQALSEFGKALECGEKTLTKA